MSILVLRNNTQENHLKTRHSTDKCFLFFADFKELEISKI